MRRSKKTGRPTILVNPSHSSPPCACIARHFLPIPPDLLRLPPPPSLLWALPTRAAEGYALFFDDLLLRAHAWDWFFDVLPRLQRPPPPQGCSRTTTRLAAMTAPSLGPQTLASGAPRPELIALLAAALLLLFPTIGHGEVDSAITFDALFSYALLAHLDIRGFNYTL
ncbi:hypothetical protein ZWY2020_030015 [Hordeum vulgare]|nr:hypothetical protein ZWY2020_030015 [Hordeum vulgare]